MSRAEIIAGLRSYDDCGWRWGAIFDAAAKLLEADAQLRAVLQFIAQNGGVTDSNAITLAANLAKTSIENTRLRERLTELEKWIADLDTLEEYAGKDGRREWASHTSTWLYPDEAVYHGPKKPVKLP